MKIGIIGAGISGLSIGHMLKQEHDVEILESSNKIGGIARTREVNGYAYHITGGHCFNSKFENVKDFVFKLMPRDKWNKIKRDARIYFRNQLIPYPIEFSINEIYKFNPELAFEITHDFFIVSEKESQNLEEWFINKFGKTLASEYFIPYNKKIWGRDPKDMSYKWVSDKLPIPNKKDFFEGLINKKTDSMPHSFFYYPKSNNQNEFIECLAKNQKISLEYKVQLAKRYKNKWLINNEKEYDLLISTIPLNLLPYILEDVPTEIFKAANNLKYNRVTTMLWEAEKSEQTWTYFPQKETIFHRNIHIGNFFRPKQNVIITEAIGEVSEEKMITEGKKFNFLLNPLSYHVSKHAYVVFDENYSQSKNSILNYFDTINLFTLGRFGEWEYYNMDICIKSALNLTDFISKQMLNNQ